MNLNQLNKRQLAHVVQVVTGIRGDYARTSIDDYKRKVKLLRNANPDAVDQAMQTVADVKPVDKKAERIAELEAALRTIAAQSLGPDWTAEQAIAWVKQHARETLNPGAQ